MADEDSIWEPTYRLRDAARAEARKTDDAIIAEYQRLEALRAVTGDVDAADQERWRSEFPAMNGRIGDGR